MHKSTLFLFFVAIFALAKDNSLNESNDLYAPLGGIHYLTSSFGENRGTRYHAGVDYSTNMQEGLPILAPENGTVIEIRQSPYFYGKVSYFKGESNITWVFAHQSGFAKNLDSLVRIQSFKTKRNDIKLLPNMPLKKGDTIGYSGSTGIGNPHLHLEMRKGNDNLYLPCQNGVLCGDTVNPSLFAAAAWNKNGFKVTGDALHKGCLARPNGDHFYLAFKIADYSRTPYENPMSIRSLKLEGKSTLYEKVQDSLRFSGMLNIRTELLWAEEADTAGDWHYIKNPVKDSVLTLTLTDALNNKSVYSFNVKDSCTNDTPVNRTLYQDSFVYTFLSRVFISKKACPIALDDKNGNVISNNICQNFEGNGFEAYRVLQKYPQGMRLRTKKDTVYIANVTQKKKNKLSFFDVTLDISNLKDFDWPQVVVYRKRQTDSLNYMEFQPKGLHFTGNVEVCANTNNKDLYYLGETTRRWFYFSKQETKGNFRCVKINEIRDIASFKDSIAPVLKTPYKANAMIVGESLPVLRIPVQESASGIENGNAINAYVKNEWIPVEYDSEERELVIEYRYLKDADELSIELQDEAKNKGHYTVKIP